ncbi:SRPBCC family protein [Dyella tabacisoli]|uniref:Polyketide cyclase n=1 Tax=Dyella tabacisoli TaxID=2282381 RepID=A0A369UPX6_9GAMM|nr:SRPBCC family protein [Dyella tabacisoli]RDD81778.1 polyketide cyclase [Dyella tabacisoli]
MLKLLTIVVALIIALLVYASTRPDTFRVQRTATIKAAPEKIFALINDFHAWSSWSPYEKLDPNMTRAIGGSASGQGAMYEWDGNKKAGKGRMEIIESSPSSKIAIKLDFIRPFEGHNTAEFTLEPRDGGTQVTWSMYGPSPFMSKLIGIFMNLDTLIGKDFEAGLSNLKANTEK